MNKSLVYLVSLFALMTSPLALAELPEDLKNTTWEYAYQEEGEDESLTYTLVFENDGFNYQNVIDGEVVYKISGTKMKTREMSDEYDNEITMIHSKITGSDRMMYFNYHKNYEGKSCIGLPSIDPYEVCLIKITKAKEK
jgi:hypothetical protein